MPEFIDPVFSKTSSKRSFSVIENERVVLVFAKTGFYKFGHWIPTNGDKNTVMVPKSTGQYCSSAIRLRSAERHSIWSFSSDWACRVLSTCTVMKRKKVRRKATLDNSPTKLKAINQARVADTVHF